MALSSIRTDIDYERDGKQTGWLHLPQSVTRSAYGNIAIPIAVIRNGAGPTAFFMAGNHGDEFEGQVALSRLIRTMDPGRIQGRVIILPAANLPAAMASSRVSPVDGGNLNRAFPGDPDGPPTAQIAHYITHVLLPLADLYHDFHAGGTSLQYLPFVSMFQGADATVNERTMAALKRFGAPLGMVWVDETDLGCSVPEATRRGIVGLGGEFGGGGSVSPAGIRLIERGIANHLAAMGILAPETPETAQSDPPPRLMEIGGGDYFVTASEPGLFEPHVALGDAVGEGQVAGEIHIVDHPGREPAVCRFQRAGTVVCLRHPGRAERGDCVAHLATDWVG